jgi:hypothetical protein
MGCCAGIKSGCGVACCGVYWLGTIAISMDSCNHLYKFVHWADAIKERELSSVQ